MKHAFTVDLEDWYQGVGIPVNEWSQYEKRIRIGADKLITLLDRKKTKATFFILGKVIEEHPELIKDIIREGHEIGCHTYSHPFLYTINEQTFKEELAHCQKLIAPFNTSYTGFRAPYFSVDHRSWWALDILKEHNFKYDSSIFPGDSKRTGIQGYNKDIHVLSNDLIEVPVSTFKMGPLDFGVGGGYFRLLPYTIFKNRFNSLAKHRPVVFYIHPWELDPNHPYLPSINKRIRYPHYVNLKSTESKLEKLLGDFEFSPLIDIINKQY